MSQVEILRVGGGREVHEITLRGGALLAWVHKQIAADCVDTVNLWDGRVMIIDDSGLIDGRERNEAATTLYHSVCIPGTTSPISGDVVICLDALFGGGEGS